MDYITPSYEELEEFLPEEPEIDDILDAQRSLRTTQKRGGAVLTAKILDELLHLSKRAHERIDEIEASPVVEWDGKQKDDVRLFFTFVGQVQEHLLQEAVVIHLISDDCKTDKIKSKIKGGNGDNGWPAKQCIDYLNRAEIISDGFKGELWQTRNERNETVHDITRWIFAQLEPEELRPQVKRGERSIIKLLDTVYGFNLAEG